MIPYAYAVSLPAVGLDELWAAGFRGMIVDVDNTLVGFDADHVADEVEQWVIRAKALGFRMVLLSNNFPERVGRVATALACPSVPNALKPLPFGFFRALRILGTSRRTTVIVGDQLMTDIIGASFFGIRGVLVNPIAQKDFPLTRVLRFVEKCLVGSRRPSA